MDFGPSERPAGAAPLPTAVKILIAGGFGVGKTTMVGAVSETRPLRTEEVLTETGVGVDDLSGVEQKTTTTVAMDFGRITISDELVLYLFGTPGQDRFWYVWDELALGAIGAVVLADTRRLAGCFPSIDYFEERGTPFVVAVNCFEGARQYRLDEVQVALNLDPDVPVVLCDARQRESSKEVLITLLEHAMKTREARRRAVVTD
ncbi:ATP-binding protein [Micromonospora globispora]|uniref:ATP-binding protein n=1 Tax=Micromonospora globispora TaxID=1450148 RepID=A0A317JUK8_9ACTN|nr:ATP/GTP-binding protein [Micromonospora globispora]PWU44477.1 ATP-binding protein [Micromonospora globispora]PWU61673.1 ATP-binding protein [Micromonospora globispora]RQX03397.1 ATP-binding protein [Micromonospora globispora]